LESDVPSSITPCLFLPSNFSSFITKNGLGLPTLYTDQEEKALVGELSAINSAATSYMLSQQAPTVTQRLSLNESVISGDSGNPIFLILNSKLVLLSTFTWGGSGSGTAYTHFANLSAGGTQPEQSLNDLIAASDATAGVSTGYKISFIDLQSFATQTHSVDHLQEFASLSTVENNLLIRLNDVAESAKISIFDLLGSQIINDNISDKELNIKLPHTGVYIVTITNKKRVKSFKVLVQ
jgi:Secretion system C-terminal sorting domain